MPSILLFGASGAVGSFLLPRLQAHYKVVPVSRTRRSDWLVGDLKDPAIAWPATGIVISLGPLDAFAEWLGRQTALPRRVMALSSMSADTKLASSDLAERALAERLRAAEARIFELGTARNIACTIFRPTLIYGTGWDRSLAPIARFARRWRVMPLPSGAMGLRQPVHAADLATACIDALDNPATYGKTYALGGGEQLPFAALLRRIAQVLPGWVLPLPVPRFALLIAARLWRRVPFTAAALARLRQPLTADNTHAARDFGFAPMPFRAQDVLPDA